MKSECNFPNEIITEKHLQFFYKYGFMMIRGLHNQEMIKNAFEAANSVIKTEVKDAEEQGR